MWIPQWIIEATWGAVVNHPDIVDSLWNQKHMGKTYHLTLRDAISPPHFTYIKKFLCLMNIIFDPELGVCEMCQGHWFFPSHVACWKKKYTSKRNILNQPPITTKSLTPPIWMHIDPPLCQNTLKLPLPDSEIYLFHSPTKCICSPLCTITPTLVI